MTTYKSNTFIWATELAVQRIQHYCRDACLSTILIISWMCTHNRLSYQLRSPEMTLFNRSYTTSYFFIVH